MRPIFLLLPLALSSKLVFKESIQQKGIECSLSDDRTRLFIDGGELELLPSESKGEALLKVSNLGYNILIRQRDGMIYDERTVSIQVDEFDQFTWLSSHSKPMFTKYGGTFEKLSPVADRVMAFSLLKTPHPMLTCLWMTFLAALYLFILAYNQ